MYNNMVWGNNMDRKINSYNNGFTLAETLIVVVILGTIAVLTIPSVIRKHMEAVARTKIKKSMSVYDMAIQKMAVENNLKTDTALANWANSVADCGNTSPYFKIVSGSGCQFKTPDGVWWNISDILNPAIGLTENDINTFLNGDRDNKNAFAFVTSYDSPTSAFRINDLFWEKNQTPANAQKVEDLGKLFEFITPNSSDSNIEQFKSLDYFADLLGFQTGRARVKQYDEQLRIKEFNTEYPIIQSMVNNKVTGYDYIVSYNSDNSFIVTQTANYSHKGPDGEFRINSSITVSNYDKNGKKTGSVKTETYTNQGEGITKKVTVYDAENNVISEVNYDESGNEM